MPGRAGAWGWGPGAAQPGARAGMARLIMCRARHKRAKPSGLSGFLRKHGPMATYIHTVEEMVAKT